MVARHLGLQFDDSRLGDLADTLRRRLETTGDPPSVYFRRLQAARLPRDEGRALAQELTVQETYFFRHLDQFRAVSERVLPERIRARGARREIHILSVGCASGEEAYSLAIAARRLHELDGWNVSIRGIDLSAPALEKAARGRYSAWSLRETPPDVQARYFRPDGREFVLDDAIRQAVTFEERNLVEAEALGPAETFDLVFCRNVIMYFTRETARAVVARLFRSLAPGGFLFLGHAETLRGLSQDFHLCHTNGTFYYQRRPVDGAGAAAPQEEHASLAREAPLTVESDESWVETIRRASQRIENLTRTPAPPAESAASLPARRGGPRPPRDLGVAIDLLRRERFGEAQEVVDGLPADARRDPDVLLLRAVLLTHGGDLVRAEELCRDLLAQDEMSAGAHYLLALCREDAGDRAGAVHHDQLAAYLDPEFAMPRLHLGLLARRAADLVRARRELEQALLLLGREDASRLLLFGGGFGRAALLDLCRAEWIACGGTP